MRSIKKRETILMDSEKQQIKSALIAVCLFAYVLRIVVAFELPNICHPDEVFQYLEQAHRLVFGYGIIPWEFREGVRSWFFPGLLAGIMRMGATVFPGPFGYIAGVRVSLALLSLLPVIAGFLWAYRVGGIKSAIVTGFSCAVWFELVYFAATTMSEAVASNFLTFGLFLCYPESRGLSRLRLFLGGIAIGLAVSLRLQLAPAAVVIIAYVGRTAWRERWTPISAGMLVPVFAVGLLDWATWGYPFQSFWKYYYMNTFQGIASSVFGSREWYYYIGVYVLIWSGAVALLLWFVLAGARRLPLLFIVAATIVVSHTLISHKEMRFVFPAIPLVIILAGLGSAEVLRSSSEPARPGRPASPCCARIPKDGPQPRPCECGRRGSRLPKTGSTGRLR